MATRSHLRFIQGSKQYQLFKFHDGYPESTIPELKKFFKMSRNLEIDEIVPSYITYRKIQHYENKTIKEFLKSEWKDLFLEVYMTDVTDDLPSDIEFFYVIDLNKKQIHERFTNQLWSLDGKQIKRVKIIRSKILS